MRADELYEDGPALGGGAQLGEESAGAKEGEDVVPEDSVEQLLLGEAIDPVKRVQIEMCDFSHCTVHVCTPYVVYYVCDIKVCEECAQLCKVELALIGVGNEVTDVPIAPFRLDLSNDLAGYARV